MSDLIPVGVGAVALVFYASLIGVIQVIGSLALLAAAGLGILTLFGFFRSIRDFLAAAVIFAVLAMTGTTLLIIIYFCRSYPGSAGAAIAVSATFACLSRFLWKLGEKRKATVAIDAGDPPKDPA
jgi:hypothetical protein